MFGSNADDESGECCKGIGHECKRGREREWGSSVMISVNYFQLRQCERMQERIASLSVLVPSTKPTPSRLMSVAVGHTQHRSA